MEIKVLIISSFSSTGISDRAQIAALTGLHELGVKLHILLHENSPQSTYFKAYKIPVTEYSIKGEGLSRTIIEAMSLKKPVVATNVGGNPELIINKNTGLLIAPKSPKDIADAIIQYKQSPDLRKKMAQQGFNYIASEFTVDKTVDRTLERYTELKNELISENR